VGEKAAQGSLPQGYRAVEMLRNMGLDPLPKSEEAGIVLKDWAWGFANSLDGKVIVESSSSSKIEPPGFGPCHTRVF